MRWSSGWKPTANSRRSRRCSAVAPTSLARNRTRMSARSASACPVYCRCPTTAQCNSQRSPVICSTARCRASRSSTAKIIFTPTSARTTKSRSSIFRQRQRGMWTLSLVKASSACESPAPTSRRTSAKTITSPSTVAWTLIAPACRCSRSFPSRICEAPTWLTNT